jgi:hypothetical protein
MSGPGMGYELRPVPAYVVTRGRTRASCTTLRPETLLTALLDAPMPDTTNADERKLLNFCRQQLTLAETAVALGLPISVTRIIASDLIGTGLLAVRDNGPQKELLERILAGLQKL